MTILADTIRSKRQAFAAPGGSHDRLVRILARGLPIGIGAVAAVMLLAPLSPRDQISFLLDRNKVAVTTERLRVNQALYRGSDNQGRPFMVSAGQAAQTSATDPTVRMDRLVARMQMREGPAQLSADHGDYDIRSDTMTVPGAVDFRTSDGYHLITGGLTIDLKRRFAQGHGGVVGAIPAGNFSADRMEANLAERTVALDGHAHLRMQPGKLRKP